MLRFLDASSESKQILRLARKASHAEVAITFPVHFVEEFFGQHGKRASRIVVAKSFDLTFICSSTNHSPNAKAQVIVHQTRQRRLSSQHRRE